MLMNEIYMELEEKLKKYAAEEEAAKKAYEKAKMNKESIAMAMESLSTFGDFKPSEEEEKEIEKEKKDQETKKNLIWKHKNAVLVKYGKDGTKLGAYSSQAKLAKQMNVSAATPCTWMKQSKEEQIRRRGFYLEYEY